MSGSDDFKHVPFPTTQWTLVKQAGAADPVARRAALETLIKRYAPAIHSHLVLVRRMKPEEADDAVQEFLLSKILEQEIIGQAEQSRGRLRSLLLMTLQRFLISEHRARLAQKRAAGTKTEDLADLAEAREPVDLSPDPANVFDIAWARSVLHETLNRMEQQYVTEGRPELWGIFESRVVRPTLYQEPPEDYSELLERYKLESPAQASNLLVTAKRAFVKHMRGVIGEYVAEEAEIDVEIADLELILAQRHA